MQTQRGAYRMRRMAVISAAVGALILVFAGVAFAATLSGTKADDFLEGTKRSEELRGLSGDDFVNGLGGNDIVRGGAGRDEVGGGRGADVVYGGPGRDNMIGHADKDLDRFYGGRGNDTIQVRDVPAVKDVVNCGAGKKDKVYVDKLDKVKNCEIVRKR